MPQSVKEKVVKKAIQKIEKRIAIIDDLINAKPILALVEINDRINQIIQSNDIVFLNQEYTLLIKRRSEQLKILDKQKKLLPLLKEKAKITFELHDLKQELYYINQKKK